MTGEESAIWTALIVAVPTVLTAVVTPIVLKIIDNRKARQDRREDWHRQDEVARKVEEAARTVKKTAREADVKREEGFRNTSDKLNTIHGLVNSNMTIVLQSQLEAVTRGLSLMNEMVALRRSQGEEPSPAVQEEIDATAKKVSDLQAIIADREKNS